MSSTSWAEALLDRFAVPLVTGAKVHIGSPLGPRGAQRLAEAVAAGLDKTPSGQRLEQGRQAQLQPLGREPQAFPLAGDAGAALLIVALHDLLFMQHPEAVRLKPEGRSAVLRGARQLSERALLFAAEDELEPLYGRHSLLAPLFQLGRDDTRREVRGETQIYKGTAAPRRWLSSDDEEDEVQHVAVLPELVPLARSGGDGLRTLFFASPLTDLYQPLRETGVPAIELRAHAGWLRLPEVARLLTRRYLELGIARVGPALTTALLAECQAEAVALAADDAAAAWLCLLSHLHLTAHVVASTELPAESAAAATLDFYALYAALHGGWPALAMPPDVMSDPSLRSAAADHAERCRRLAGQARVHKLLSILGKPHVETA